MKVEVNGYIAEHEGMSLSEVRTWWNSRKKTFDFNLRSMIGQLEMLRDSYRMFDVPQEHCCFQIIQDARKYYFMYKNDEKSPFTREHARLLSEIRFIFGKPPVKKLPAVKKPPAKKLQSMKVGYALRCRMIPPVPPLSPVVPV